MLIVLINMYHRYKSHRAKNKVQKEKKRIYGSHLQYDGASRSAERRFYGFRTSTERVPVASVDDFAWKISSRGTEETGIRGTTCQELHLRECICLRSHEPSFYPVDLTQRPFTLKLRAPSAPPPPPPLLIFPSLVPHLVSRNRGTERVPSILRVRFMNCTLWICRRTPRRWYRYRASSVFQRTTKWKEGGMCNSC